jgi:hypothetical protein
VTDTIEAQARDTVNEGAQKQGDDGHNAASRLIRVTEHYVRMDYEGNGIAHEEHQGVDARLRGLCRERPDGRLYRVTLPRRSPALSVLVT